MKEYAYETMHCDEKCGVCLEAEMIIETDGNVVANSNNLMIEDAKIVNAYLMMKTDFADRLQNKETDREKQAFDFEAEYHNLFAQMIQKEEFSSKSEYILQQHIQDFQTRMERCILQLESGNADLKRDMFLFQYGRYLLLCASREDSILPTHLQGIWNDDVACRIGWSCDMHLDINTQMNYWHSEITNLTECNEPLFHYVQNILMPSGERTARRYYGLRGWVAELVSNAWGYTNPYWATPLSPCPTGGVWILTHMWEHYLYTKDQKFLEEKAYPIIKNATEFFCEYVFQKKLPSENVSLRDSVWIGGPSISPENSFGDKSQYQISNGCTYEITMIRELFSIYKSAAEALNDTDNDLYANVIQKKLLPYRIQKDGTIAEYDHEEIIPDKQHRHTSHLLGLYPFSQINIEETPELCRAAEQTIQQKINPIEGWEDTGWASSMLFLYEARLCHGDRAYGHLQRMKNKLMEKNMMIYHPSTRGAASFAPVYELDGNTGITSGIAELLLQSHNGILRFLPALPKQWENGKVCGLRARGNITVNIEWEHGIVNKAELLSSVNQVVKVKIEKNIQEIFLEAFKIKVLCSTGKSRTK